MRIIDHFCIYYSWYTINLRCDLCNDRSWGSGELFTWSSEDNMNLGGIADRAQEHWDKIHKESEGNG